MSRELLRTALQSAVPLWVMSCKKRSKDELLKRGNELAQVIAEKGDVIQFKSKKKGESSKAFNALAEATAIMSFQPGGVTVMGDHYENQHPEDE